MSSLLRGKRGGVIAFIIIAGLVTGGLAGVTAFALRAESDMLRLEHEQAQAQLQAEREKEKARTQTEHEKDFDNNLRLALSLLDGRIAAALAKEDHRPYSHYSAVYATSHALIRNGDSWKPDTILELSPLLSADLPDWMLLHFQTDDAANWGSPQVLSDKLFEQLANTRIDVSRVNVTHEREQLLLKLQKSLDAKTLLTLVEQRGVQLTRDDNALLLSNSSNEQQQNAKDAPTQALLGNNSKSNPVGGYETRAGQYSKMQKEDRFTPQQADLDLVARNSFGNGADWFNERPVATTRGKPVSVNRGPMVRLWLTTGKGEQWLVVARLVHVGSKRLCQGIVLDWPLLQKLLAEAVSEVFPQARFEPQHDDPPPHPERTMTTLPVEMITGPLAGVEPEPAAEVAAGPAPAAGWTSLRVGLAFAWLAALVALAAVGLGGWTLIDLSERRIRFVNAVTHELRTPMTTLRLYLDMLTGGIVKEEKQKEEYLHTLNAETDRLNRLIGNVLDFSRLENQKPRLNKMSIAPADLLEQTRCTWQGRCQDTGKKLIVENMAPAGTAIVTDVGFVQQILGNLIDNACKYSHGAADPHIWMRARTQDGRLILEVEDRGPGVLLRERRSIFHAFRRGRDADVTAGGVGLGLALAQRWASLLGGELTLCGDRDQTGACFRLALPLAA